VQLKIGICHIFVIHVLFSQFIKWQNVRHNCIYGFLGLFYFTFFLNTYSMSFIVNKCILSYFILTEAFNIKLAF